MQGYPFVKSVLSYSCCAILSSEVNKMDLFGFDWNGNGTHDAFDTLMDTVVAGEVEEDED